MPVRGLIDFDGLPVLLLGEDSYSHEIFPNADAATPSASVLGDRGAASSQGLFDGLLGGGVEAPAPYINLLDGLLGGGAEPGTPAPPVNLLDGLLGGGNGEETPAPAPPPLTIFDLFFDGLFGGNEAPQFPSAGGEGHWLTVGLLGGRIWVPAEAPSSADELGLIICPADQPIASGHALPADLFGTL